MCIIYKCIKGIYIIFMFLFVKNKNLLTTWQPMRKENKKMTHSGTAADSARAQQARDDVTGSPAILSLGVSDGAVLLSEVKPQLTLVSEVEVTFFAMIGLLSSMNAHVALECLKVAEVCSADLTRIRLLSCVN